MKKSAFWWTALMWLIPSWLRAEPPAVPAAMPTLGWIQTVRLLPERQELEAKLDTGADNSSLDARNIQSFERSGEEWVSFAVRNQQSGSTQTLMRKVEKWVRVRSAAGVDRRPVVRMQICVGQHELDELFSLRDRQAMEYPVLLGRSTIAKLGAVDVTRTHTELLVDCHGN